MSYIKDAYNLIGNTPMVSLGKYKKHENLSCNIVAKLEWYNMTGSVKDRIVFSMIEDAEKSGLLKKNGTIIEATSGNTGIGLAAVGACKGYKVTIVMPETMSMERVNILKAYGANVILTDGKDGMSGAIKTAAALNKDIPDSVILNQFENKINVETHSRTTATEIIKDMEGNIDYFVAGVGTAGTLVGIGTVLKKYDSNIKIIAVEPKNSAVLSKRTAGEHKIQGIGAGFVPPLFNRKIVDEIISITNESAFKAIKTLAMQEGLLVGISSGAALVAATEISKLQKNKNIVAIFPDSGEKYLSTGAYF